MKLFQVLVLMCSATACCATEPVSECAVDNARCLQGDAIPSSSAIQRAIDPGEPLDNENRDRSEEAPACSTDAECKADCTQDESMQGIDCEHVYCAADGQCLDPAHEDDPNRRALLQKENEKPQPSDADAGLQLKTCALALQEQRTQINRIALEYADNGTTTTQLSAVENLFEAITDTVLNADTTDLKASFAALKFLTHEYQNMSREIDSFVCDLSNNSATETELMRGELLALGEIPDTVHEACPCFTQFAPATVEVLGTQLGNLAEAIECERLGITKRSSFNFENPPPAVSFLETLSDANMSEAIVRAQLKAFQWIMEADHRMEFLDAMRPGSAALVQRHLRSASHLSMLQHDTVSFEKRLEAIKSDYQTIQTRQVDAKMNEHKNAQEEPSLLVEAEGGESEESDGRALLVKRTERAEESNGRWGRRRRRFFKAVAKTVTKTAKTVTKTVKSVVGKVVNTKGKAHSSNVAKHPFGNGGKGWNNHDPGRWYKHIWLQQVDAQIDEHKNTQEEPSLLEEQTEQSNGRWGRRRRRWQIPIIYRRRRRRRAVSPARTYRGKHCSSTTESALKTMYDRADGCSSPVMILFRKTMTPTCFSHDLCYMCTWANDNRPVYYRVSCDAKWYRSMVSECKKKNIYPASKACIAQASVMFGAVAVYQTFAPGKHACQACKTACNSGCGRDSAAYSESHMRSLDLFFGGPIGTTWKNFFGIF